MDPKDEESWIRSIYNHRHKQNRFAEHINMPQFAKRAIENLYAGKIEAAKQNSIYVGLPRKGRRIDLKGRISTPTRLTDKAAKAQITLVNDFMLCLAAGVIKGVYCIEIWELLEVLTHDLVNHLKNIWPYMTPSSQKVFVRFMELNDFQYDT